MRFLILPLLLFTVFTAQAQTTDLSRQTPNLLENLGQLSNSDGTPASQVLYYMNTPALDFYITKDGITYVFKKALIDSSFVPDPLRPDETAPIKEVAWHRVDASLEGAQINPQNVELVYSKQSTTSIFNDRVPQGLEHLSPVASITLKNVYPGIDWQFVVENDFLKYNFILHEGADISAIKVLFKGQDRITLSNNSLLIETSLGTLKENKIEAFTSGGKTVDVQANLENEVLTYRCDEKPMLQSGETWTIDPPLVWGTYFGGSLNDVAIVMERNNNGFIYVLLETYSTDFPLLNQGGLSFYQGSIGGTVDVGISKFTEDGVLVWSCYYGGSGDDKPSNLFYNGSVLMIVGSTRSANFPTMSTALPGAFYDNSLGGLQDGFVAAFTLGDTRIWGTYLGGSSDYDNATDCSFNDLKIYVVGYTYNDFADFPLVPQAGAYNQSTFNVYDAFVTEFNTTFAMTWSTIYGGSTDDNYVYCDIDSANRLLITFNTTSSDITPNNTLAGSYTQAYAGGVDLGIAMFNSTRQLIWSTYYGGTGNDWANDVICDQNSNWYFVGNANNASFPVANNIAASFYQPVIGGAGTSDAIIVKFDSSGQRLYSSFYGGTNHDVAKGITIDSKKNIYIVGYANSATGFTTFNPNDGSYFDGIHNGNSDEFLMQLDSSFSLKWATYLGGIGEDVLTDVRVSPLDHVFAVGYTKSAAHPLLDMNPGTSYYDGVINAAGSTTYRDAIIMKFIPCPEDFDTIHFTDSVCYGDQTLLYATGSDTYTWNLGSTNDSITATIVSDTTFSLIATYLTCIERDTVHIVAKPLPVINITGDSVVCFNDTVHLFASGGVDFQWENGLSGDTISYVPTVNDTISLTVINSYSCTATDSVEITVHPLPTPSITGDTTVCLNDTLQLEANGGTGFLWSNATTDSTIEISQNTSGFFDYFVVVTDTNSCIDTAFQTIEVFPLPVFNLGNDTTLCQGNSLLLQVGFINANFLWSTSATTSSITVNTPNDYSLLVTDSNSCLFADTINVAVIPYADATIDSIAYVCENNPSFPFTAAEAGGIWSGIGIVNTTTGTYDPAVAGVGFFSVYYTIGGFCGDADSTIIEIAEVPSFTFVTTDETCAGANDGTLIISASGGAAPYTFILDTILISDTATNLAPLAYNLFVLDTRGCVETDSVFIIAEEFPCGEVNFYIPNIFSPNGDGSNDVLYVRSDFIDNMKFLVYDRFGEKVFESTNPDNGWDGKYNGQPVVSGVYHYFINVNLIDGTNVERKGNVTIVR